ncbi:MAG: hypothetical protein QOF85_2048 [Solirubrobacterales bacterium]|jgi:hypothetical protein|nr:hypothetical protein [Solirubrobacterales bacterium]
MSGVQSLAEKWTCEGCGVSASRIDGESVPLPDTWANSAEGLFCLVCRRQRAAEAALDGAPSDSPVAARAKLRRAALIEFEVSRTPDHADGIIARACRTSVSAVTRARRRLELPDPPPPSKASRAKHRAAASR